MSKINYKIILIGNSGVGKTSIFRKLFTGEFTVKIFQQLELRKKQLMSMVLLKIKMEKKKQDLSVFPYLILLDKKNLEQ